jgi:uncharacterized protein (TIGR02996 family)
MTVPVDVLHEFLYAVVRLTAEWDEGFAPALRGSLLLHHWYGLKARPPADIDLECFDRPGATREFDPDEENPYADEDFRGEIEGRFGRFGEYVSRVDLGKAMCRYGAGAAAYQRPGGDIGIRFSDDETPPADGASLWVYGTPGKRYYAAWESAAHRPSSGRLQLDLATPGAYTPADLGVRPETLAALGGAAFAVPCYSPEAMLAAKVSWLVRSFPRADGRVRWTGEAKDLFDARLIASDFRLRPAAFRRAMLAIGASDGLTWTDFDPLFDVHRGRINDNFFGDGAKFAALHPKGTAAGPVEMWADLATRLLPLLGDMYPADAVPLLRTVHAQPTDPLPLMVLADWLDERDDLRGLLTRRVAAAVAGELDGPARTELAADIDPAEAWPHLLFGTSARLAAFRTALAADGA